MTMSQFGHLAGHEAMSDMSPLSAPKRTSAGGSKFMGITGITVTVNLITPQHRRLVHCHRNFLAEAEVGTLRLMPESRTYALAAFFAASNTSRADVVPATCSVPSTPRYPSCIHGLKHFLGRSGVALRDAELLERFRPPCTRDCKGFHVDLQDFTQLLRDFIRADHRTKLDDALP
jgi:hypothetical protein